MKKLILVLALFIGMAATAKADTATPTPTNTPVPTPVITVTPVASRNGAVFYGGDTTTVIANHGVSLKGVLITRLSNDAEISLYDASTVAEATSSTLRLVVPVVAFTTSAKGIYIPIKVNFNTGIVVDSQESTVSMTFFTE